MEPPLLASNHSRQRHFPAANTLIWIKTTRSIAIRTDITPVIPSTVDQAAIAQSAY
jgi:hypothetical protein